MLIDKKKNGCKEPTYNTMSIKNNVGIMEGIINGNCSKGITQSQQMVCVWTTRIGTYLNGEINVFQQEHQSCYPSTKLGFVYYVVQSIMIHMKNNFIIQETMSNWRWGVLSFHGNGIVLVELHEMGKNLGMWERGFGFGWPSLDGA